MVSCEKVFWKTLAIVASILREKCSKDSFGQSGISDCVHYPVVYHITDATVIQMNRPVGDHSESK